MFTGRSSKIAPFKWCVWEISVQMQEIRSWTGVSPLMTSLLLRLLTTTARRTPCSCTMILRTSLASTCLATTKDQAASWNSRNVMLSWDGGWISHRWPESIPFLKLELRTNSTLVAITGLMRLQLKPTKTLQSTKPPPSLWRSATTVKSCSTWTSPAQILYQPKSATTSVGAFQARKMELFQLFFQLKCLRSEAQQKETSKIFCWLSSTTWA